MAYVEWHGTIPNHYKTKRLMKILECDKHKAVGILGCLVAWAIENRPGGRFKRDLVAIGAEWEGDPEQLVKAMVKAGWLDEVDRDEIEMHDWEDVTRGYRKARADAARKRYDRSATVRGLSVAERSGTEESAAPNPSPLKNVTSPEEEVERQFLQLAEMAHCPSKPDTQRLHIRALRKRLDVGAQKLDEYLRSKDAIGKTVNDWEDHFKFRIHAFCSKCGGSGKYKAREANKMGTAELSVWKECQCRQNPKSVNP